VPIIYYFVGGPLRRNIFLDFDLTGEFSGVQLLIT
jgi:hypothetical protein